MKLNNNSINYKIKEKFIINFIFFYKFFELLPIFFYRLKVKKILYFFICFSLSLFLNLSSGYTTNNDRRIYLKRFVSILDNKWGYEDIRNIIEIYEGLDSNLAYKKQNINKYIFTKQKAQNDNNFIVYAKKSFKIKENEIKFLDKFYVDEIDFFLKLVKLTNFKKNKLEFELETFQNNFIWYNELLDKENYYLPLIGFLCLQDETFKLFDGYDNNQEELKPDVNIVAGIYKILDFQNGFYLIAEDSYYYDYKDSNKNNVIYGWVKEDYIKLWKSRLYVQPEKEISHIENFGIDNSCFPLLIKEKENGKFILKNEQCYTQHEIFLIDDSSSMKNIISKFKNLLNNRAKIFTYKDSNKNEIDFQSYDGKVNFVNRKIITTDNVSDTDYKEPLLTALDKILSNDNNSIMNSNIAILTDAGTNEKDEKFLKTLKETIIDKIKKYNINIIFVIPDNAPSADTYNKNVKDNPKEAHEKLLELINFFENKAPGKINIQKYSLKNCNFEQLIFFKDIKNNNLDIRAIIKADLINYLNEKKLNDKKFYMTLQLLIIIDNFLPVNKISDLKYLKYLYSYIERYIFEGNYNLQVALINYIFGKCSSNARIKAISFSKSMLIDFLTERIFYLNISSTRQYIYLKNNEIFIQETKR